MTSVVEKNNSPDIAGDDLLLHQQYFILNSSENLVGLFPFSMDRLILFYDRRFVGVISSLYYSKFRVVTGHVLFPLKN